MRLVPLSGTTVRVVARLQATLANVTVGACETTQAPDMAVAQPSSVNHLFAGTHCITGTYTYKPQQKVPLKYNAF